jgi:hypothetical protein
LVIGYWLFGWACWRFAFACWQTFEYFNTFSYKSQQEMTKNAPFLVILPARLSFLASTSLIQKSSQQYKF